MRRRSSGNTPVATAIRCHSGRAVASPCSAMLRIRCIRWVRMARRRRSSMRAVWRMRSRAPNIRARHLRPMTTDIVASNRRGGPEGVIDAVEQLAPQGFADVDTILNYEAREAIVRGYAAKAGFAARVVSR